MIDLHSHTTASDGQHTPADLVRRAKAAGVTTLAVTDHDTLNGLAEARAAAPEGLQIVPGIEISSVLGKAAIHLLGHLFRPDDAALLSFCARQEGERRRRMEQMVRRLNGLGLPVSMAEVEAVAGESDNLCRPHLARVLVDRGWAKNTQDAFHRFIGDDGPAFVGHDRITAKDAIALVHAAGGTVTLAHPGSDRIDRNQIARLRELGMDGLEVFHPDHDPGARDRYLGWARELDLVPTAGSDFHGARVAPDNVLGAESLARDEFERLRSRARNLL